MPGPWLMTNVDSRNSEPSTGCGLGVPGGIPLFVRYWTNSPVSARMPMFPSGGGVVPSPPATMFPRSMKSWT